MFIGHYKSVKTSTEFYSEERNALNFPTQVIYKNERFLLNRTIQISSPTQRQKVFDNAKDYNIEYDVKID